MAESDPSSVRSLGELEASAANRLPPAIWDYVAGGAGEERTVRANRAAFRARTLQPRVLSDVRSIDLTTTLLGTRVRLPVFVAPTAYQASIHPEGEAGTARGAHERGVLATFSTLSSLSL